MSGIVALLRTDGAGVDPIQLSRLAGALAARGPDGCGTRVLASAGLGHTLLATTPGAVVQPVTLDGEVWVTADARIDARADLVEELEGMGHGGAARASDAELLLHAYRAWGEACPEHLLGDFSFVLWDGPRRRLFAARDPFGVKLLFYAQGPGWLVLSNTLGCVRLHPGVSDRLDDAAVGSFLLFGYNADAATTTFADVASVPPAHTLSWTEGGGEPRLKRYWSLPEDVPEVGTTDPDEILARFRSVLTAAVRDRMRGDSASVFMSGGLDSPMIAATALDCLAEDGRRGRLEGLTVVYQSLFEDPERSYSELAVRHLGIPLRLFVEDRLYTSWS